MPEVECEKCGHNWEYSGQSDHFCTCPSCKSSVKLEGETTEDGGTEADEVPETVVLEFGEMNEEVEVEVDEAIGELVERIDSTGSALESVRDRVDDLDREVDDRVGDADLTEQEAAIEEVARLLEELFDEMGGSIDWEHVDTEPSEDAEGAVASAAEKVDMPEFEL